MAKYSGIIIMCCVLSTLCWADGASLSVMGASFSHGPVQDGLPLEWEEVRFIGSTRLTQYELVNDEGVRVMKATSVNSASGLARGFLLDIKRYPMMTWRWKVEDLIPESNLVAKSGDDHPARIYVMFAFDPRMHSEEERLLFHTIQTRYRRMLPARALCYVWATHDNVSTVAPSPYTRWIQTIVVESGNKSLGQWRFEERNVYKDYKRVFGTEPPRFMGIGIMTDSDSTHWHATAYYGDIRFWNG